MQIIEVDTNLGYRYILTGSTPVFYNLIYYAGLNIGYVKLLMKSEYGAKESHYSDNPYMLIGLVWEKEEDIEKTKEWFESLRVVNKFSNIQ